MSFENDAGDDWGEEQKDNQEIDTATLIENMFYQGEFDMEKKPDDALESFKNVIEMEQQNSLCNYMFKATKNMIVIYGQKGNIEQVRNKLKSLLKLCPKVAQNEARDTLSYVLDQLTKLMPPADMESIYQEIVPLLKQTNEKLWQSICSRLCRMFLEKKKYKELEELCELLKASMRGPDGAYDEKKGSPFEVLALQMQMYAELKDHKHLKQLHSEAKDLSGVVTDARVNAMLKECGAMIYLSEKNWESAQEDLMDSFKSYQQLANPKAKAMLKLLIAASVISGSEINPMTLAEAKVYQDDPEISVYANLRKAFEDNQTIQLKHIMRANATKISNDKDMKEFVGEFFKAIKQKIVIARITSYSVVSIQFLGRDLGVSDAEMKSLLVELILDERVNGKIDESKGLLEVSSSEREVQENRKYAALERMTSTMTTMLSGIIDSVCS